MLRIYEGKYQFLINKQEGVGLEEVNNSKAFIDSGNDIHYIYGNVEEYNPDKEHKILIVFDDMTADMLSNKKLDPIVTELLIRGGKLHISLVRFFAQSDCAVPENIWLNATQYFIMKIPNKRELQQIVFNHSSDISYKDFMNL